MTVSKETKAKPLTILRKAIFITIGALIMAIALEGFLLPHNMMDGGVVGISIMTSHLTGWPLGIFLFVLNIPFFILGYKQIGTTFAVATAYGIGVLSYATVLLHGMPSFQGDDILASLSGGILLGVGVGIVIRNSGALDGTEILAILLSKKLPFSVGEIVMVINAFIFTAGGFIFGWESALYSMLAYIAAAKTMDIVIKGMDESMLVWVISDKNQEIGEMINVRLGRGVTYFDGSGAYSGERKNIIFSVINRLEEAKLKEIVMDIDKTAFVAVSNISEVRGGNFKKKDIH